MNIIKSLISLRKEGENENYVLNQYNYIRISEKIWGQSRPTNMLHHHNRVQVYGLIMIKGGNREIYQMLAEVYTSWRHVGKPTLGLKQMCQNIAVEFNNEEVVVNLSDESLDLDGIQDISSNDMTRVRVTRYFKLYNFELIISFYNYTNHMFLLENK